MPKVDLKALIQILGDHEPANQYLIERATGKIIKIDLENRAQLEQIKKALATDKGKYIQVPKASPRENHADMERFIAQVHDPKLKENLKRAMTSHRPFREFRDVLETKVKEKREWEAFQRQSLEQKARTFVKGTGLEV